MNFINEDWLPISSMVAFLLGVLPFLRFFHELISSRRQFKVKNLELFYQSFGDNSNPSSKLVIEQQFISIFNFQASYCEISCLLQTSNVSHAIQLYSRCNQYVELNDKTFGLKNKYLRPTNRLKEYYLRRIKKFTLYFITAFLAASIALVLIFAFVNKLYATTTLGVPNSVWAFMAAAIFGWLLREAYNNITDTHSIKYADEFLCMYDNTHIKVVDLRWWQNAIASFKLIWNKVLSSGSP